MNGKVFDQRYKTLDYKVSEYDIQFASGVINILSSRPLSYQYYSPDIVTAKRNTFYEFWARPTIGWDLKCDHNRQAAYKVLFYGKNSSEDSNNSATSWVLITSSALLLFSLGWACIQ